MVRIIFIDKFANFQSKSVKSFSLATLHKKCNLKSSKHFEKRHTWHLDDYFYSVYAKDAGRANNENKCELPPPLDNDLYFGTILVLKHTEEEIDDDNVVNLSEDEWTDVCTSLFGGFEDLNSDDDEEEDELENVDPSKLTKSGYYKDDFVVEDEDEDEDEDYHTEEDEYISDDEQDNDDEDEEENNEDQDEEDDEDDDEDDEDEDDDEEDDEDDNDEEYSDDDDNYYSELSEDSYVSTDMEDN